MVSGLVEYSVLIVLWPEVPGIVCMLITISGIMSMVSCFGAVRVALIVIRSVS